MSDEGAAEQCVALLDYQAQLPDEISFRRGDILHVTHKGGNSGYWQGYVAYPASMSATIELAMAKAQAGDEAGAAHILAQTGEDGQDRLAAASWPMPADVLSGDDSEDVDSKTAAQRAGDPEAHPQPQLGASTQPHLFPFETAAYAGSPSPPVPHSGEGNSKGKKQKKSSHGSRPDEKTSSPSTHRNRRGVISSFFSSLKSGKSHKTRDRGDTDEAVKGTMEAESALSASGRTNHSKHHALSETQNQESTPEPPQRARDHHHSVRLSSTVGRRGLFPNCLVSSNVSPDLALMRAFQQKCLALFPYSARDATELSFDVEDVLTAVRPGPAPGWWYGYNVSALEPVRRQARRQLSRCPSHTHRRGPHPQTERQVLTDVVLPWEKPEKESEQLTPMTSVDESRSYEGGKTPDRPSRKNPPLHLSPFLFSRCSARFDEVALSAATAAAAADSSEEEAEDAVTSPQVPSAAGGAGTSFHTPTAHGPPLATKDVSEHSFVSGTTTNTSNLSFGSTLMEPHNWSFLSSLDPITRAKVEAHCGTYRKPLLFPTSYVTSDIVLTVFRFDRRHAHELSIDVGDVIRVHRRWNDGWWEGSLRGARGVFPSNYTVPNVPSLPNVPQAAHLYSRTASMRLEDGSDDMAHTEASAAPGGMSRPLALTMAAMTFPPAPHTPLSPYAVSAASPTTPSPLFFCPACKTTLAVESRAELAHNTTTCRTCQQHETITDAMLVALETYVYGAEDDVADTDQTKTTRPPKLDLFEKVPLFPSDVSKSGSVPSLLTNKDVADVSFGRIKFV